MIEEKSIFGTTIVEEQYVFPEDMIVKEFKTKTLAGFELEYPIGAKIIVEMPKDVSDFIAKRLYRIVNDYILEIGIFIDLFNENINDLNRQWDTLHPEVMQQGMKAGTQLYNDYGHYILRFYTWAANLLTENSFRFNFFGYMIGADPIMGARMKDLPDVILHLEYYDTRKENMPVNEEEGSV